MSETGASPDPTAVAGLAGEATGNGPAWPAVFGFAIAGLLGLGAMRSGRAA